MFNRLVAHVLLDSQLGLQQQVLQRQLLSATALGQWNPQRTVLLSLGSRAELTVYHAYKRDLDVRCEPYTEMWTTLAT